MAKPGSKKIKIKVKTEDGEIDRITDNSDGDATEVDLLELNQALQSPEFKYVGMIFHAVTNPRCVYIITASGSVKKVCR
jgi:hypothetical protein